VLQNKESSFLEKNLKEKQKMGIFLFTNLHANAAIFVSGLAFK
jgi:hypothetical protein